MALELVKLDSTTLPGIADAIRAKTGDAELLLPSQMAEAIRSIQTGVELPDLTNPAEDADVLAGKEYIDADGVKRNGTLVDKIKEIETVMGIGGISIAVESTAGAAATFDFDEPNLQPDNIIRGVSIYNVSGNAKTLRVETGTITPAEDCASLTVVITGLPKSVSVVAAQSYTPAQGDILGACYDVLPWRTVCGYNGAILYFANGSSRLTQVNVSADAAAIGFPAISSSFRWRAGVEYTWTAYYWEDGV